LDASRRTPRTHTVLWDGAAIAPPPQDERSHHNPGPHHHDPRPALGMPHCYGHLSSDARNRQQPRKEAQNYGNLNR